MSDRHGGRGRPADRRDPQRHHIRCVGDKEKGDEELRQEASLKQAVLREAHTGDRKNIYGNACLQQAQQRLIDHVGGDIGGDVHSRPVLAFDDIAFTADHLDGVEASVPETDAGHCQGTDQRSLHAAEQAPPDHDAHESCHQRRHGQHHPVVLIEEHAEQFPKIDLHLADPAAVTALDLRFFVFIRCFFRHDAPPDTSLCIRPQDRLRPLPSGQRA